MFIGTTDGQFGWPIHDLIIPMWCFEMKYYSITFKHKMCNNTVIFQK